MVLGCAGMGVAMTTVKGPNADELRLKQIVTWHARGHDALDRHGIPRIAEGLEYTIEERIDLLAAAWDSREKQLRGLVEALEKQAESAYPDEWGNQARTILLGVANKLSTLLDETRPEKSE